MLNKYIFANAKFYITVNELAQLPLESIQEVAIGGRSNSGKSTLINIITNQIRLAFTSKTPGRTQHINYFTLNNAGSFLVDLPGYGYAKVPAPIRAHWEQLLSNYLQHRQQLVGLVLIMDSRHPLKPLDYMMLKFFQVTNKPIHIVLSKADKLNKQEQNLTLKNTTQLLHQSNFTNFTIQLFSATKRQGIEELDQALQILYNNASTTTN